MNYLCLIDGIVEYGTNDWSTFNYYQFIYAEQHRDSNVQYLTLTDEEYDEMFPPEEDE